MSRATLPTLRIKDHGGKRVICALKESSKCSSSANISKYRAQSHLFPRIATSEIPASRPDWIKTGASEVINEKVLSKESKYRAGSLLALVRHLRAHIGRRGSRRERMKNDESRFSSSPLEEENRKVNQTYIAILIDIGWRIRRSTITSPPKQQN